MTITLWLIFNGKTMMKNFIFLGRLGTLLLLVLNQAVYFYIPGVWMEPAVQVASGVFFTLWTNRILYNFLDIITLCLEAYERIPLTSFREQTVTRIYKVLSHLNDAISENNSMVLICGNWFVAYIFFSLHLATLMHRICHVLTVRRLRWRRTNDYNNGATLQLASCSLDHSVRIFNVAVATWQGVW